MDNTEKTNPVEGTKKFGDSAFTKACKLGIYESLYVYYKRAKNRLVGDDRIVFEDCLFNFNLEISYARAAIEQGDEFAFDRAISNLDLINASLENLDKKDVDFSLSADNSIQFTNHALAYALKSQEDTKPDMVNHPPHYNVNGFEAIDIIKAFTEGLTGIQAVDTGNAIKYILRWHNKNGVEDLKKARWYIDHLIKELER